jgi:threonine/homoserine/homoserine lactone efflux protein
MITEYFLKGIVIGFTVAVPVGPINVLCAHRTLSHGRLSGIVSGLGAAIADTAFACIAAFGLFFLIEIIDAERVWFNSAGAVILAIAGFRTYYRAPPPKTQLALAPSNLLGDFTSTFALTLANPITIFSFITIYAAFDIHPNDKIGLADWLLLLGVFLGSMVWWSILTGFVGLFHKEFTPAGLKWANRIAGIVILACALIVAIDSYTYYRDGAANRGRETPAGLRDAR